MEGEGEVDIPGNASSLDFLQAVYRDSAQPMTRRIRCAVAALPFERPKLAVVATMSGGKDFAALLEAAISRGKVIEGRVLSLRAEPTDSGVAHPERSSDIS